MPAKRKHCYGPPEAGASDPSPAQKRQRQVRRSDSAPPPPCVPLTASNLRLWELCSASAVSGAPTADMTPSTASDSRKSIDNATKLEAHGIYVDYRGSRPPTLVHHVDNIIGAPRLQTTPSASKIAQKAPLAATLYEQGAIDLIGADILFKGAADGGEALVTTQPKLNLNTAYLPSGDSFAARETGSLSQAQPDTALGYIIGRDARLANVDAPLTSPQEFAILRDALTSSLHFPFLTCQWKGYTGSEGQYHAALQGARDGACIVNYLHHVYTSASCEGGPQSLSVVDWCHFSVTSDMDSVKLWLHWREDKDGTAHHYMQCIKKAFLEPIDDDTKLLLVGFRKMVRNILEYATGPRLDRLKVAVEALQKSKRATHASMPPSVSSNSNSRSRRSSTRPSAPPTPASFTEPMRKRLREEDKAA